jgi:hypothetical protein
MRKIKKKRKKINNYMSRANKKKYTVVNADNKRKNQKRILDNQAVLKELKKQLAKAEN